MRRGEAWAQHWAVMLGTVMPGTVMPEMFSKRTKSTK